MKDEYLLMMMAKQCCTNGADCFCGSVFFFFLTGSVDEIIETNENNQ